ncbi:MAG: serine protease [Nanoarchaeota archaeon]|nr:serine protease [Nanoarchaeota archaeon]
MSLTEKVRKYCTRLVASAVLAATVMAPASCAEAMINYPQQNVVQQVGMREYSRFVKGAFDKKYDNHNMFYKESLDDLLDTTHKVYGHLTIELTKYSYNGNKVVKHKVERTMTGQGSAVVVGNDGDKLTLVTANHVVNPPPFKDVYDVKGRPVLTHKVKEVNYILEQTDLFVPVVALPFVGTSRLSVGPELKVVARDKARDIAIIQTKKEFSDHIKHYKTINRWGNSKELKVGDFLYAVGFPRNITKQLASGYVSAKGNPFTPGDDHRFIVDMSVNPGNSDGPVYALRDGKPELVGIVSSKWPEGIGGIIRIDSVKKLMAKIGLSKLLGVAK